MQRKSRGSETGCCPRCLSGRALCSHAKENPYHYSAISCSVHRRLDVPVCRSCNEASWQRNALGGESGAGPWLPSWASDRVESEGQKWSVTLLMNGRNTGCMPITGVVRVVDAEGMDRCPQCGHKLVWVGRGRVDLKAGLGHTARDGSGPVGRGSRL
jgi:hypothetical protein